MSTDSQQQPQTIVDLAIRERIATKLDESQIVEAAAGTGKTRILVERIVRVLVTGAAQLANIVVVTFTEKAAGELKLRVRQAIEHERKRGGTAIRRRLDGALEQLEEAHVNTIHGFCADLLREYPIEAGVDPDFAVLGDEVAGGALFDAVFTRWFDELQASDEGLPTGMARVLRRGSSGQPGGGALDRLRAAAGVLREHRDLDRPWTLPSFDLDAEVDALVDQLLYPLAAQARTAIDDRFVALDRLVGLITLADEVRRADSSGGGRDHEQVEARLWALPRKPSLGRGPRGAKRDALKGALDEFYAALEHFKQRGGAQLAALLQRELRPCLAAYEREKRATGQLDFMDMLLRARALLAEDRDVREQLQSRFSHVFIDEFQDTDPLQAEILLLLCSDDPEQNDPDQTRPVPGKLFVVGDPKQSIYRFRRADVALYERIKAQLTSRGHAVLLELSTNFRAVPALRGAVNAAFAPLMKSDAKSAQAGYVALASHRPPIEAQPALVALPIPRPYGQWGRITKRAMRQSEPPMVASWVKWLVQRSGWRVSSRRAPDKLEPIAPHDVCLLFRNLRHFGSDLTRPYVEALERHGVPHVVVGGRSFFVREEVDALITALRVVEWPRDELAVYATLRGPLFGFDDELLLHFVRSGGRLHARSPGRPERGREVLLALELLGGLHPRRNHRPLADTIGQLIEQTRCLGGFALRNNGEQAVSSILRVQDLARRFERGESLSFRAFVQYLEAQGASELADADSPVIEESSGGVRMMSVHRAKGLEFPVVILVDPACAPSGGARHATDRAERLYAAALCGCAPIELQQRQEVESLREQAEGARLLYVAATRARDLLAVPCLPDTPPFDSWLAPLSPVLSSSAHLSRQAPGCPPFGRAQALMPPEVAPPTPGVHRPAVGDHQIIWWDPSTLEEPPRELRPLRDWELLDPKGACFTASVDRYLGWRQQRDDSLTLATAPSCEVQPATAVAHQGSLFTSEIVATTQRVAIERSRAPGGPVRSGDHARRFGTLVHNVLEEIDLELASGDQRHVAQVSGLCARLIGLSDEDAESAAGQVIAALRHPLLVAAARATELYKEVPIATLFRQHQAAPLIVEGIIDLAFAIEPQDDAGPSGAAHQMVIIDYKTDAAPDADQIAAYRRQVALYSLAVERALGCPTLPYLLFV